MLWKIQACKTILRHSRCQLKPKTQPHLHMCPSVCFYTLFFQPVGEVVFIQAAVWFFFSLTHHLPFYPIDVYFKKCAIRPRTSISIACAGTCPFPGKLSHLCRSAHSLQLPIPARGSRMSPEQSGVPGVSSCAPMSGLGHAATVTIQGEPAGRMEVLWLSSVESLRKSCVNRRRATKSEPLQLWASGAIWGWIC